jgi:hypothetical protein
MKHDEADDDNQKVLIEAQIEDLTKIILQIQNLSIDILKIAENHFLDHIKNKIIIF